MERLRLGDGSDWCFLNGSWQEGSHGELVPPDGGGKEYVAVCRDRVYTDLTARFRFLFRGWYGGVRLLFRLQDLGRYYALDIPWGGQQNRNRHFWAGLVVADGTPLQRYLHLGLVPGVCPEHGRWYEARLDCHGSRIRAWIEGRLAFDVVDTVLASGRIGLMAEVTAVSESAHFADLEVEGETGAATAGFELRPPAPHWRTPCPVVDPEAYQSYPTLVQARSGHLTLHVPFGNPNAGRVDRALVVGSDDGGRTWSTPAPATLPQGFGASFARRDDSWVCVHARDQVPADQAFSAVESTDQGRSWSAPRPLVVRGAWPAGFALPAYPSGRPLRLRDGSLLLPAYCAADGGSTNYVFRSTDDGRTWEAPVRCDANNPQRPEQDQWFCPGNFSEIGLAEVGNGEVLGFGRPGPWPFMWQVHSLDGGRTWRPAAFGPFPGYCITLTNTRGGALVAIHRFPYLTANVSHDGGRNWDAGTILDYAAWANHQAVEVEPEVVLVVYMGHIVEPGQADTRALRLRVTGGGLAVD